MQTDNVPGLYEVRILLLRTDSEVHNMNIQILLCCRKRELEAENESVLERSVIGL